MKKIPEIVKSVGLDIAKSPIMTGNGRVLMNHAIMYILEGNGTFKDEENSLCKIVPGTVFYLYPGRWHKFDPAPGTTWSEYWMMFDGKEADRCFGNLIPDKNAVFNIGMNEELIEAYEQLFDLWLLNAPPNPLHLSYLAHTILCLVYLNINKIKLRRKDDLTAKAKAHMKYSLIHGIPFDPMKFVKQEGVSYESFRKNFKTTTSQAPNQYYLRMKINRATSLLLRPNLTIKEIAERIGIEDPYYFSRLFKIKMGVSPNKYRQNMLGNYTEMQSNPEIS